MSGLENYDQWKTASPYDHEDDVIELVDKLLAEPEEEWSTPPTTGLERMLLSYLRDLRQILEDEAGI